MEGLDLSKEDCADMAAERVLIMAENNISLTKFPDMVIDRLAVPTSTSHESRYSLDKLAAILTTPESWLHNIPKLITSCQIELESEDEIEAVLITKDKLSWTNICLRTESYIQFGNFPRFASQFGPQIQILKLDKFFGSIPEISFISCCLSLKSLTIIQLDVRQGPRLLLPSEFPNLSKTFGGVKLLRIDSICFDSPKQLEFFKNFLQRFPKLEHLSVPQPLGPKQTNWDTLKSLQSRYLIKPVTNYLNERHNNMSLPSNPVRRTVNSAGVFSSVFPDLAMACAKNGAFVSNVSQKQIQSLFLAQDTTLCRILHLNDGLTDRRPLARWINLEKVSLRSSLCEIRSETSFRAKSTALFPLLKSIHLIFDSESKTDPGFTGIKLLLRLFIGQKRLGVNELSISWPMFGHNTPPDILNSGDIVANLPNVKKFHAFNWRVWDDELITLLRGLKSLEHLALEECSHFTEFGLLGPHVDQPLISSLKDLKYLELVSRNSSYSISNTTFIAALRNMSLRALVFDVSPNLVTKEGYFSLCDGPFADSIWLFPEPRVLPRDMNHMQFQELRKRLKNFNISNNL